MDAFELVGKLTLDNSSLASSLNATGMEGPANAWGVAVGNLAAKAFSSTFSAATKFARSIFETGMDFDAQLSGVSSIKDFTEQQFTDIREKAIDLGRTTKYTATEVGEAFYYMGLAGWDSSQMIAGIEPVLNLAAASGENLGRASDIVTDALTAFGYTAKDASMFVDVLAQASANSNTTVGMMGEAFKYLGPVAGSLGYTVQDVAIGLGLLANSGIKASQAGTSLRQILGTLENPSKEAAGAMEALGISIDDGAGKIKPFRQLVSELRQVYQQSGYDPKQGRTIEEIAEAESKYAKAVEDANAQLKAGQINEKQYSSAVETAQNDLASYLHFNAEFLGQLGDIGGLRGISSLLAIMMSTDEDFDQLVQSIEESEGAAEKMRDKQIDNLKGDITLLNSAMDGLKIMVSDEFKGDLRNFVSTFTEEIGKMGDAFQEGGLAGMFTNLADWVINGITGALSDPNITVQGANDFGAALGTFVGNVIEDLVTNAPTMVAGLFTAGLNLAQGLISGLFTGLFGADTSIDTILQGVEDSKNEAISEANATATKANGIVSYMDSLVQKYGDAASTTQEWKEALSGLNELIPGIDEVAGKSSEALGNMTESMRQYIEMMRQQAIEEAKLNATSALREKYIKAETDLALAQYNRNLAQQQQQEAVRAIAQNYMSSREKYYSTPNEYAGMMHQADMFDPFQSVDEIVEAFNNGQVSIKELSNAAETFAQEVGDTDIMATVQALQQVFEQAKTDFEESNSNIESLSGQVDALQTQLSVAEAAVNSLSENATAASESATSAAQSAAASADTGTVSVAALHDAAKAAAGSYDLVFNVITNGSIPSAVVDNKAAGRGNGYVAMNAKGDWNIPYDNYPAILHRDEMVLTASQARQYREGQNSGIDAATLASAMRSAVLDLTMEFNGREVGRMFGDSTTARVNRNIGQINRRRRYGYGG